MFKDRSDAALKLAKALAAYSNKQVIVLGIPRGGVEVAYYVARQLNADFSLIITRKLGYPENPEAAFGAIAEDGSVYLSEDAAQHVAEDEIREIISDEKKEIERRINVLRKGKPLPDLRDKTVIIVDDGIATGATVFSAIALCKKRNPAKIIVAAPIASQRMEHILNKQVDGVIILEKPPFFYAVGQGYENFENLNDERTVAFINAWQNEHVKTVS